MEPMIGMIGCGNMGRAIVEGILKAKVAKRKSDLCGESTFREAERSGRTWNKDGRQFRDCGMQ